MCVCLHVCVSKHACVHECVDVRACASESVSGGWEEKRKDESQDLNNWQSDGHVISVTAPAQALSAVT